MEISNSAYSVLNNIGPVLKLIKENVDEDSVLPILSEITFRCITLADMFKEASRNTYLSIDYEFRCDYRKEYIDRILPTKDMLYLLGDLISDFFGDEYSVFSLMCWKRGIEVHQSIVPYLRVNEKYHKDKIIDYGKKINKFDKDYEAPYEEPPQNGGGGCYIATSVYGSYDCPEVWTLRRFRDNTLESHIFGRMFIKLYYATSPSFVKYFGDKKIFNKTFKPILDKVVQKLNDEGIESSFYIDK